MKIIDNPENRQTENERSRKIGLALDTINQLVDKSTEVFMFTYPYQLKEILGLPDLGRKHVFSGLYHSCFTDRTTQVRYLFDENSNRVICFCSVNTEVNWSDYMSRNRLYFRKKDQK